MCPSSREIKRRGGSILPQRGFSVVTAVFLVVVLALLGVFIVRVVVLQQSSQQMDVRGVRAYQAARAGIEWAAWQTLDPNNALNPAACGTVPACPAASATLPALAGSLSPFTVVVTCTATATTEGTKQVRVFTVSSTATAGTAGTPDFVSRQVQATLSKCHDPAGAPPRCACS